MNIKYSYLLFAFSFVFISLAIYQVSKMEFTEKEVLCKDYDGNEIVDSKCIQKDTLFDALFVLLPALIIGILFFFFGLFSLRFEKAMKKTILNAEYLQRKVKNQLAKDGLLGEDDYDYYQVK